MYVGAEPWQLELPRLAKIKQGKERRLEIGIGEEAGRKEKAEPRTCTEVE